MLSSLCSVRTNSQRKIELLLAHLSLVEVEAQFFPQFRGERRELVAGHQKSRQVEEVFEHPVAGCSLRQISVARRAARAHFGANHAVHHQSVPLPPHLHHSNTQQ